jgi:hypothetical protein
LLDARDNTILNDWCYGGDGNDTAYVDQGGEYVIDSCETIVYFPQDPIYG